MGRVERKYELESFFGSIADSMLGNYRDFVKGALKNYFIPRQVFAEFQFKIRHWCRAQSVGCLDEIWR